MTYTSLLLYLSVACAGVTGVSLLDFHSYDSHLSALSGVEGGGREISIPSLQEDIEHFSQVSPLFRSKRNAMDKHHVYPKCCGSGDIPDFTAETVQIYENCKAQLNESEEVSGRAACDLAACIGKKKGLINTEGYVIAEGFLKLIEEAYTHESLKEVAKRAGPICAMKGNEYAKKIMGKKPQKNACNPAGILAYHCTKYEVILNCPEEETVKSAECRKFRSMMEENKRTQKHKS